MNTPFLIDVKNKNFDDYIGSLSANDKKDYKRSINKNKDIQYEQIVYSRPLVKDFMELWEEQTIGGRNISWPFGIGYVHYLAKRGKLLLFCAKILETEEIICLHFVEFHRYYLDCHPPMFDKQLYNKRSISRYMWFCLIKFAMQHESIEWLDLYGGSNGQSWRDLVYLYKEGHVDSYKWKFIPQKIKENPSEEKPYVVKTDIYPFNKSLIEKPRRINTIWEITKWKILSFLYLQKGRRIAKMRQIAISMFKK